MDRLGTCASLPQTGAQSWHRAYTICTYGVPCHKIDSLRPSKEIVEQCKRSHRRTQPLSRSSALWIRNSVVQRGACPIPNTKSSMHGEDC